MFENKKLEEEYNKQLNQKVAKVYNIFCKLWAQPNAKFYVDTLYIDKILPEGPEFRQLTILDPDTEIKFEMCDHKKQGIISISEFYAPLSSVVIYRHAYNLDLFPEKRSLYEHLQFYAKIVHVGKLLEKIDNGLRIP